MYLNYFWTCILLVFSRYLKLYFLFQSCFLFWGYFFLNWGVIHKTTLLWRDFLQLSQVVFVQSSKKGHFTVLDLLLKSWVTSNVEMQSKAQAHLIGFALNVDNRRNDLPVSILLLINWNAEETPFSLQKSRSIWGFLAAWAHEVSWCLSSERSDCRFSVCPAGWGRARASTAVCMSRRLPSVTGLSELVLWHHNNALRQFYKPLQCNMCYFPEANQRYISQGSAAFSSIWWRIFFFIHL